MVQTLRKKREDGTEMDKRKLKALRDNTAYTLQDVWKYIFIGAAFGLGFHFSKWVLWHLNILPMNLLPMG
jgi:uncharacterized membrane protein YraQ (UPF0718 family)